MSFLVFISEFMRHCQIHIIRFSYIFIENYYYLFKKNCLNEKHLNIQAGLSDYAYIIGNCACYCTELKFSTADYQ